MNFDFMKNLEGLKKAYPCCENAEKLAITIPDMSITSARKSAEALAKYVYQRAHAAAAYSLTFDDILKDPIVIDYLGSSALLSAFHFIRKQGNRAVHTLDDSVGVDSSIHVLERLHHVMGEVAIKTKQITSYPPFNEHILPDQDAKYKEFDENTLAQEMFRDYIAAADRAEMFFQEFQDLVCPFQFAPGDQELVEILEFHHAPKNLATIKQIQEHFAFLATQMAKYLRGKLENDMPIEYAAELTVYGEDGYTSEGLGGFVNALQNDLTHPNGFKIVSSYTGPTIAPMYDPAVRKHFDEVIQARETRIVSSFIRPIIAPISDRAIRKYFDEVIQDMGASEDFSYKSYGFYYDHGEGRCTKFLNGKWINLKEQYTSDILDLDFGEEWWSSTVDMVVEFDFDKYPDILQTLKATVSEHLPDEQLEDNIAHSSNADEGALLNDIQWSVRKLRTIQNFFDKINCVLEPILSECKGYCTCDWFITSEPLAVATCIWTEKGFQIVGTSC